MSLYPVPGIEDTRDIGAIAKFAHNATGGILFPLILLFLWFAIFMLSLRSDRRASESFTFASFICFILSTMLGIFGVINTQYIYLTVILTAIGSVWLILSKSILN